MKFSDDFIYHFFKYYFYEVFPDAPIMWSTVLLKESNFKHYLLFLTMQYIRSSIREFGISKKMLSKNNFFLVSQIDENTYTEHFSDYLGMLYIETNRLNIGIKKDKFVSIVKDFTYNNETITEEFAINSINNCGNGKWMYRD